MRATAWSCSVFTMTLGVAIMCRAQSVPDSNQVASCPTVLPIADGERSVVVPSVDPLVDMPSTPAPHIASRPLAEAVDTQRALLQQKLTERDRIQREITELRAATKTPEQILVRVKIMEINRTKLQRAGVQISVIDSSDGKPVDLATILCGSSTPAVTGNLPNMPGARFVSFNQMTVGNAALAGVFEQLETQNFVRTIAAPEIVVLDGKPASMKIGGEIPIPPAEKKGAFASKDYGTQLDVTATTLGDNQVRLALHPRISEIDDARCIIVDGQKVPALNVREVQLTGRVEFGRSILMSGLEQERHITKSSWGFRQSDDVEQIALVVLATPELVR
jgi:Flp pilus assembly secretin CpaC